MTAGDVAYLGAVGAEIESLDGVLDDEFLTEETLTLRLAYSEGCKMKDPDDLQKVARCGRLIALICKNFFRVSRGGKILMDDKATFRLVSRYLNLDYQASTSEAEVLKRHMFLQ